MQNTRLTELSNLVNLGLTKQEANLYAVLVSEGSLTASGLASRISVLPNAVYRLVNGLEKKGFVTILDTTPKKFQAISPSVAIEALIRTRQAIFQETAFKAINSLSTSKKRSPQTRVDTIFGRAELFSTFVNLAKNAKKEILIVSIGESVTDDIKISIAQALEKEIEIKFIVHQYNKENKALLFSWAKMGVKVRHYEDWGYHLMIFDGEKSVLATNNPRETAERTGMVFHSWGFSKAMKAYFFKLWKEAKPITGH